jgi:hypothetical protein
MNYRNDYYSPGHIKSESYIHENHKYLIFILMFFFFFLIRMSSCGFIPVFNIKAQEYTRGVGIYPGKVSEDFAPVMHIDDTAYRNLALRRAAWHSSSINYNLTAQLITDGIIDTAMPGWILTTSSQNGKLKKNEREWILDRHPMTSVSLNGPGGWIQFETAGSITDEHVDSINISGSIRIDDGDPKGWDCIVSGSVNGISWSELGRLSDRGLPGDSVPLPYRMWAPSNLRIFSYPFSLKTADSHRFYRVELNAPNAINWSIGEFELLNNDKRIKIGGPYHFTSAWMSEGNKQEWVYVDLGASCRFDSIVLYWIMRPEVCTVQVSDDTFKWEDLMNLPAVSGLTDNLTLDQPANGRFIRLLIKQLSSARSCILSEMQVFGAGGPVPLACSSPAVKDNGRMDLAGGAWRLQRGSLAGGNGEILSQCGFNDNSWVIATVPATVLVSYLNTGAIPDPNFGDNQLMISESFFYSDFWYRTEFVAPESYKGRYVYINFDGINWKAEVFLNGHRLGRIEGAFTRGQFNVTEIIKPGEKNALAILVEKNATPGFVTEQTFMSPDRNGGELGADNPTFHASVGWDWIPTIRGRNTGIWNDVYLTSSGQVTIKNPFVITDLPLPDTTNADISIELSLCNHSEENVTGTLIGTFDSISFEYTVTLRANETMNVKLDSSTHKSLKLQNPKLWWPKGYGNPYLYRVELKFITGDNQMSDIKSFLTGVRELTCTEEEGKLKIWINGRRFAGRGGNWGFSESMLRYRAREYDIALRYHSDMDFTMIRNWVGQTGDDEFFDACDRHGIMVWQDFWLANPVDGPDPDDNKMFMDNAGDFVMRIRNHPCVALYCGRNEGNPPRVLDNAIRKMLTEIHPGVLYISNSAWGTVSGGGPYRAMPLKFYFKERATEKLHSEIGMPNIVSYESLCKMMPESAMWPQGNMWGLHDFCLEGAQRGSTYNSMVEESFGAVDNLKEWLTIAQWINYQGYRAMFEAQGKNRMGLLLWMSHPAWPSLVWQTYDYYFEPTAAYFGCKKASEPLHIQWNILTDSIEVINYSVQNGNGLTAGIQLFNLDGTVKWEKNVLIDCHEDSKVNCFAMHYPEGLTDVYFLRLKLLRGNKTVSENFYWRGLEEGNYRALRNLPKVTLETEVKADLTGNRWHLTVILTNRTEYPALMVRLKVVRAVSGDLILPVLYSDNYISLMPGEQRTVAIEVEHADTLGENPAVIIEGLNITR